MSGHDDRWPEDIPFLAAATDVLGRLPPLHDLDAVQRDEVLTRVLEIDGARQADLGSRGRGAVWHISPVSNAALAVAFAAGDAPGGTLLSVVLDVDILSDPQFELGEIDAFLTRTRLLEHLGTLADEFSRP
jgi:hypothetical protein